MFSVEYALPGGIRNSVGTLEYPPDVTLPLTDLMTADPDLFLLRLAKTVVVPKILVYMCLSGGVFLQIIRALAKRYCRQNVSNDMEILERVCHSLSRVEEVRHGIAVRVFHDRLCEHPSGTVALPPEITLQNSVRTNVNIFNAVVQLLTSSVTTRRTRSVGSGGPALGLILAMQTFDYTAIIDQMRKLITHVPHDMAKCPKVLIKWFCKEVGLSFRARIKDRVDAIILSSTPAPADWLICMWNSSIPLKEMHATHLVRGKQGPKKYRVCSFLFVATRQDGNPYYGTCRRMGKHTYYVCVDDSIEILRKVTPSARVICTMYDAC